MPKTVVTFTSKQKICLRQRSVYVRMHNAILTLAGGLVVFV